MNLPGSDYHRSLYQQYIERCVLFYIFAIYSNKILDSRYLLITFHFIKYTIRKFLRYNKANLGELVPLEILSKNQQGLPREIWPRYIHLVYLLDVSLGLSKGCTKCQGSKVYLVVSSKFYDSVSITLAVLRAILRSCIKLLAWIQWWWL